jgi:hypothetical protein
VVYGLDLGLKVLANCFSFVTTVSFNRLQNPCTIFEPENLKYVAYNASSNMKLSEADPSITQVDIWLTQETLDAYYAH